MELIESGLAEMEIYLGGESSAKTRSTKKNITKPRRFGLTRTGMPKTDRLPPQIRKTDEHRGEVQEPAPPTEEQEEDDAAPPTEEQEVEDYRKFWERCFGRRHGSYDAETSLAPMYCATGTIPPDALPDSSLQFFSIKVTDLSGLSWPLQVHGFVAARDSVDRRRNYLLRCSRDNCQTLTEKDPFLRLTGPSRAVLMIDPVAIEVQLKVKTTEESEDDEVLALACFKFRETYPLIDGLRACIPRQRCMLEFALAVLGSSVETTVGVRLVDGSWPDQCAGLIVCNTDKVKEGRMVLLDFKDGKLPTKSDGTVELSRRIVSVSYPAGKLFVSVEASRYGFSAQDTVNFGMKRSGTSTCTCDLVFCKMEVTVTWGNSIWIPGPNALASSTNHLCPG
ncbi:uncharacterized protein LOC124653222 isoform X2 [Lolium rigidum]|uniref:uncharacterized protein LOC124653222 isoform X2 n=1 Tax=Lolium rigidum TaxID=89674 RepID=UPI001F5DC26C|nr:uncharacterized protein LOC124653222 isoform X2 [Lolium rigidum]